MEKYDNFKRLYTGKLLTDSYVKYRPIFPNTFFESIYEYCEDNWTGADLTIDVGCGPGISSLPLTTYYDQVIGVDVSQSQISNAPTNVPGLSFRVGPAEDLSFIQSGSVDLVTAGVALHWFNLNGFYQELDRILKPNGCFAAYSHSMFLMEDNTEINNYISHIIFGFLGKHWTSGWREAVVHQYKNIYPPFREHKRMDGFIEKEWTMEQLLGFMKSTSAVEKFSEANPDTDIIEDMRQRLCEISGLDRQAMCHKKFNFRAPVFMILSRKPGLQKT